MIVVANKCDMPGFEDNLTRLQAEVDKLIKANKGTNKEGLVHDKVFAISALSGLGVDPLNLTIASCVAEIRAKAVEEAEKSDEYDKLWTLKKKESDEFKVEQLSDGIFEVFGKKPVRAVIQTDLENEEAVVFLQHRLKRMGVERALSNAGAVDGDEIRIAGRSFEFENTEANTEKDEYGDLV